MREVKMDNSPGRERRLKDILTLLSLLLIMLAGSGLFLGSLVWRHAPSNNWAETGQDGMKEFGLSLLEAGLVILLIERRSAREQLRRTEELVKEATSETRSLIEDSIGNLFDAVYKKRVPPAIVRLYEETAFKAPFFRTHHEYTCTFYDPAGTATPTGMIRATFYQKFTMHNLTDSEKTYNLSCETQLPATQAERCRFEALMVDGVSAFDRAKVSHVERVGYTALLISHGERIAAGGSKDFQIRFENLRLRRDFEVVMMNCPSDGIIFRVTHPSNFDVTLAALHPQELRPVPTADTSKEWELKAGFMVGQGVCSTWNADE